MTRRAHNERSSFLATLGQLTGNQLALLESMAMAMKIPALKRHPKSSDLVDDVFAETMANLLTLHHATHEEPLSKKAFEYLFKNCLLAQGHAAELNQAPGTQNWDVRGANQTWSLKTEAAAGISASQIKIEKLMEARWIRECLTPELCAAAVSTKVSEHLAHYGRILVLRAFLRSDGYEYVLQEIPKHQLLDHFKAANAEKFSKQGRSISYGANFVDAAGRRIFRILLDSSVEKVRLWYRAEAAIEHGVWTIQVQKVRQAQQNSMAS